LLPRRDFYWRLARHAGAAILVMGASLGIGILGYHLTEGLPWLDSLLNASMILGGMGPVDVLHTSAGKIFASAYALFSGVVFLVTAGLLIGPVAHRMLHWLHLDEQERAEQD
jgi:NhaP-type Na+/H+ or K+/H+ antiporter